MDRTKKFVTLISCLVVVTVLFVAAIKSGALQQGYHLILYADSIESADDNNADVKFNSNINVQNNRVIYETSCGSQELYVDGNKLCVTNACGGCGARSVACNAIETITIDATLDVFNTYDDCLNFGFQDSCIPNCAIQVACDGNTISGCTSSPAPTKIVYQAYSLDKCNFDKNSNKYYASCTCKLPSSTFYIEEFDLNNQELCVSLS